MFDAYAIKTHRHGPSDSTMPRRQRQLCVVEIQNLVGNLQGNLLCGKKNEVFIAGSPWEPAHGSKLQAFCGGALPPLWGQTFDRGTLSGNQSLVPRPTQENVMLSKGNGYPMRHPCEKASHAEIPLCSPGIDVPDELHIQHLLH